MLDASGARVVDVTVAPASAYLGVLGMTGLTAYVGLTRIAPGQARRRRLRLRRRRRRRAARSARSPRRSARAGSSAAPGRPRRCATSSRTSASTRPSTTRTGRCPRSCARRRPDGIDVYFDNVGGEHLEAAIGSLRLRRPRRRLRDDLGLQRHRADARARATSSRLIQTRGRIEGFLVGDHYDLASEYAGLAAQLARRRPAAVARDVRRRHRRTRSTPSSASCAARTPGRWSSGSDAGSAATGHHGAVPYTIHTAAERPDLWERGIASASVWPEYNLHGDVLNRWWGRLDEDLPDFQFVLYDEARDEVVAEGHTGPLWWDGVDATLPAGIDPAIERIFDHVRTGDPVNTLCALAAETPREGRARGLAEAAAPARCAAIGARQGLTHLVAPVRPSLKEHYPITPIEHYVAWRRDDGQLFDPWMRIHERLGARVSPPRCPRSLRITGTVGEWETLDGDGVP